MGLDMYLYKKSYLSGNDEWIKPESRTEVTIKVGGKPIDSSKVKYIIEEAGYWRKANQIHRWFVDNVQNGNDDCGEYEVTIDQLLELRKACTSVIENRGAAKEKLPTQSGFFFGDTKYDEDYFIDLHDTIGIIDGALKFTSVDRYSTFYYRSSW